MVCRHSLFEYMSHKTTRALNFIAIMLKTSWNFLVLSFLLKCSYMKFLFLWEFIYGYPESGTQVRFFSGRNISFVCRCRCKTLAILFSPPNLLGNFEPKLAQSNLWWWRCRFILQKDNVLSIDEIIKTQ